MIWSLLICPDLKQASKPYILVPSKQHRCLVGQDVIHNPSKSQTHYIYQVIHPAVAVCYTRHRIDQKDSDTLRHDSIQTTKQAKGTFLSLSTLRLIYLLYKLPKRPYGLPLSGTFMTCCTSYWTGQTGFLWHFYDLLDCKTLNRSDGLLPSETWRLYHLQPAWVGWWPKSQTVFDLHASSVWSAGIIVTLLFRPSESEVLWVWGWRDWYAWYDDNKIDTYERWYTIDVISL